MAEPLNAAVIRERSADLDRLAMILSRPDGSITRWADDEPDVDRIPIDLQLSSSVPGGDADLSCALLRDLAFRDPDLRNLNRVKVQGAGAEDVWRGYLAKTPATKTQVSPAAVGDVGKLKGDPSLRMIPVDRDPSRWGGPSAARRITLINANEAHSQDAAVVTDSASQALALEISDVWVDPFRPRCEAWYNAGQGLAIGRIYFKWSGDSNTAFILESYVRPSDNALIAESEGAADVFTTVTGTRDFKPANAFQFAQIAWKYSGAGGTAGQVFRCLLSEVAVYGKDVPQTPNPNGGPDGVLGEDVLEAVLAKAGNGITYDADRSSSDAFVIPHLSWPEAVTAEQAVLDTNRFYRNLWGVYGGKLRWAPPETFGDRWHVRRDEGADPQLAGPDSEQEFNAVLVKYQDSLTGTTRLVGPPASGYVGPTGLSTAGLVNTDPYLPVNEWGERRWAIVEAGLTSEAGAIRIGELFRSGVEAMTTSGSIEIGAWQVYDSAGARYPAWAPSAGDRLVEDDVAGQPERLIVQASYSHSTRKANLTLDQPPNALEALQERLQVVLVGVVD